MERALNISPCKPCMGRQLPQTLDERLLEIATKIYIGQNIRDEGILRSSIAASIDEEKALIEKGLIRKNYWYSHTLYVTTSNGTSVVRPLVEEKIKSCREEIKDFLSSFPPRLTGFLINDYFAKKLDFAEYPPEYYYGELGMDIWKTHILKDPKVWSKRTEILSKLERLGLCVRTNYYVSTRGGELRESMYVVAPEIRQLLLEVSPPHALTEEENRYCRIYHFLMEIAIWFDHPIVDELRRRYLDGMHSLSIDEAYIKEVIDILAEKGITDPYLGIATPNRKPYSIKDKVGYSFYLQDLLIKPIIDSLLEAKPGIMPRKEGDDRIQILERVIRLVEAKHALTRNTAILGIDLFDSTPDIEVCITRMLKIPTTDGELKEFIEILYNYVIDRSKSRLLKIGDLEDGQITTLEERIIGKGKKRPFERSTEFEKAIQDLRIVNNLRNKLSHSKAAKDWTDIANIYRGLINKPMPQNREDYVKVQESLLGKIAEGLELLSQIFMRISE